MEWLLLRTANSLGASQVTQVVKNPPASGGDTGDTGSIPGLGRSPGEGNGNPLQYSFLEKPMDRGAWWATVHEVAKSQTWLSSSTTATWGGQKTVCDVCERDAVFSTQRNIHTLRFLAGLDVRWGTIKWFVWNAYIIVGAMTKKGINKWAAWCIES